MNIDDLLRRLATARTVRPDSTAEDLREEFLRACRRVDENPAEQQRLDDIADLLDAEEILYAQARAAADRGDTDTAKSLLRQCAEAGTGEAAWLLAQLLEETGDIPEAMAWYEHAHNDGDARAEERLAALRARPRPAAALADSPREDRPAASQGKLRVFVSSSYDPDGWRLHRSLVSAAAGPTDPADDVSGDTQRLLDWLMLRATDAGNVSGEGLLTGNVRPLVFCCTSYTQLGSLVDRLRAAGDTRHYLTHDASLVRARMVLKLARNQARDPALATEWAEWALPGLVVLSTCTGAGKSQTAAALGLRWWWDREDYGQPCPANLNRLVYFACHGDALAATTREPVVADVMLPPPEVPECNPGTPVIQALERLVQSGTQALPVCEMTRVIGIVTLADLARHINDHQGVSPTAETVKALMRPATIVPPGTPLPTIAQAIADDGIIVVSGPDDRPVGYLTAESLLTQAPPGTSTRPTAPDRPPLLIPGTGVVLLNRGR